ncbi:MAG: tolB protein precursor [Candidatus Ozemobacter sibiricus]|uniref:TolB protein n=1 Tax=Candidatus Ozemobacter sibiricus TaxID=2268124 RepID=A0A367ZTR1_9BACT|nr:MAG: tolB protein precursor [Candidatus Ozemobacter sibiricus]
MCDTPQKRRQRSRQRLFLGLFIFLAGALVGSLVDSFLFKGRAWDHSILGPLASDQGRPAVGAGQPATGGNGNQSSSASVAPPPPHPSPGPGAVGQVPAPEADLPASPAAAVTSLSPAPPGPGSEPVAALASPSPSQIPVPTATVAAAAEPSAGEVLTPSLPSPPQWPAVKLSFEAATELEGGADIDFHGSLSPDGRTLIFSSNRAADGKTGPLQCYVKEPTPGAPAVLAFPWPGQVWTPELLPDGRTIVFSSDSQKPEHLFLIDRETRQSRQLTTGTAKNMMPAVSPDGRFVAFVSNRRGNNDIWIMGLDGANLIQITSGPEDDREPRWWPDGRSLIFTRIKERYKDSMIMRVPLDPQGPPQPLIAGGGRHWLADPSPDGRYVAFVRSKQADGSGNGIFVRRLESGDEFAVAPPGLGECYRPIWTRDMTGLIFHAERANRKNLFLARLRQTPLD